MAARDGAGGANGAENSKKPDAQEHPAEARDRWRQKRRGDQALAVSALASALPMPYLRMKRSTRPSVSRIFWVPV